MTAKLLRAANSAFFGFGEKVSSIEQAVLILGQRTIQRLVNTVVFNGAFITAKKAPNNKEQQDLWFHSLKTAFAAEALATACSPLGFDPSIAFTAGLLHDIGKAVEYAVVPRETRARITEKVRDGTPPWEAEGAIIGTNHAEVGGFLLTTWRLPDEIIEAVENHHRPVHLPVQYSALTHAASCFSQLVGTYTWDSYAIRIDSAAIKDLGLTPENLQDMVVAVEQYMNEVQSFIFSNPEPITALAS